MTNIVSGEEGVGNLFWPRVLIFLTIIPQHSQGSMLIKMSTYSISMIVVRNMVNAFQERIIANNEVAHKRYTSQNNLWYLLYVSTMHHVRTNAPKMPSPPLHHSNWANIEGGEFLCKQTG